MVQVDIKSSANTINFPKNQSLTGDLVLTLHSELTQRTFTFNVTDEGNSKRFYKFTLDLSEVSNGEYDYNINNIETGLIRIGAIELSTPEVVSYSEEVNIIQYGDDRSSQFTLQSKDVEYIQNGEFLVLPDNGYYGLKQVGITVNVPSGYTQEDLDAAYSSGWSAGYESGYTDGSNNDYSKRYFTVQAVNGAAYVGDSLGVYYSIDSGTTWVGGGIYLYENQSAWVKGTSITSDSNHHFSVPLGKIKAYGNVMSLLYGDDFIGKKTINNWAAFNCLFLDCVNLLSVGNLVLPATSLTENCYRFMFGGCTSLTTAPALPATTLANYCYSSMFQGCTSLTTAPELPATTLANDCYGRMFQGCTSLTTAPELQATTLAEQCYTYMFSGCTSLNSIKCLATDISALNCTYNWVENVASTGTFIKNPNMSSWTTGISGIPENWTVQDE